MRLRGEGSSRKKDELFCIQLEVDYKSVSVLPESAIITQLKWMCLIAKVLPFGKCNNTLKLKTSACDLL